jgi:hypothetical protein
MNDKKTITISLDEYNRLQERQKQVDELTAFKNEAISMSLYGKGRKDGEEVAVKDTAKEILQMLYTAMPKTNIVVEIKKRYGVEVE